MGKKEEGKVNFGVTTLKNEKNVEFLRVWRIPFDALRLSVLITDASIVTHQRAMNVVTE